MRKRLLPVVQWVIAWTASGAHFGVSQTAYRFPHTPAPRSSRAKVPHDRTDKRTRGGGGMEFGTQVDCILKPGSTPHLSMRASGSSREYRCVPAVIQKKLGGDLINNSCMLRCFLYFDYNGFIRLDYWDFSPNILRILVLKVS
jgi:hypothetical protein